MHEVIILYQLNEKIRIPNPYNKTAGHLADTIRTYSDGTEGKLRYKGQNMRSLFNTWNEYEGREHLLMERYRTSDEVNKFIREEGTALFNATKHRPQDQKLSDHEVEGVRIWMIKIAKSMY